MFSYVRWGGTVTIFLFVNCMMIEKMVFFLFTYTTIHTTDYFNNKLTYTNKYNK